MSDFDLKKRAAISYLKAKGFGGNYAPPIVHFLWLLRIDVPPPLFDRFWNNFAIMSTTFGVVFSLITVIMPPLLSLLRGGAFNIGHGHFLEKATGALCAALVFGLLTSLNYLALSRKHAIPSWKDFCPF